MNTTPSLVNPASASLQGTAHAAGHCISSIRPEGRRPVGEDLGASLHPTGSSASPRPSQDTPPQLSGIPEPPGGRPTLPAPWGPGHPLQIQAGLQPAGCSVNLCSSLWGPLTTQNWGCTLAPRGARWPRGQRQAPCPTPAPLGTGAQIHTCAASPSLGFPLPVLYITVVHCFKFLCDGVLLLILFQGSKGSITKYLL